MCYRHWNHPAFPYFQIPPPAYNRLANEYPPVDTTILAQSVKEFQVLMHQGGILLEQLSLSEYSSKIMTAAQVGNQTEVDRLVYSIEGLYVPVKTRYTPTGVNFHLQSPAVSQGGNCCGMKITLKWGT
ncbi:hypothetical protein [Virgibacillus siamensis]|uniref:hypothetical protein n=1 Tax=Virgibacillus siamensis TaxID=480071 RepID=UPI000986C27A|nr:hypothetical protein [Virgibacillus siamensis]